MTEDNEAGEIMAMGLLAGAFSGGHKELIVARPELAQHPNESPRLFLRFPGVLGSEYEVSFRWVPNTSSGQTAEQLRQVEADRMLNILGRASNVVELSWSVPEQPPGSILDTLLASIEALREAIAPRP